MELRSDRLRLFLDVVDAGGFAKAAVARDVAQSSVSQGVAALEADVGEPLFARVGRGALLTEAGVALVPEARAVVARLVHAAETLLATRSAVVGRLRLGATDTLAAYVLPPVFSAFREQFPAVELQLLNRPSPTLARMVATHELDLSVVSLPLPADRAYDSLKVTVFGVDPAVVILPLTHPLARRRAVDVSVLAAYPLVLLDATTALRAWLEKAFLAASVAPKIAMEVASVEVIRKLVAAGFGASVVPQSAVIGATDVLIRRLNGATAVRKFGALAPVNATRAARAFLDVARAVLGGPVGRRGPQRKADVR